MALLIRQWQHSKVDCRTQAYYTVKVVLNNQVKHVYSGIDCVAYKLLLKQYSKHAVIDHVNVLNKSDLFKGE